MKAFLLGVSTKAQGECSEGEMTDLIYHRGGGGVFSRLSNSCFVSQHVRARALLGKPGEPGASDLTALILSLILAVEPPEW